MLNLSVRYDSLKSQVQISNKINEPGEAALYLMSGLYPENVGVLCANTNNFRDAMVHQILAAGSPESALGVLTNRLNNLQIIELKEDAAICEAVATLAFALNDLELTKQTMLRIPPHLGTEYIKTVYKALAIYNWDSVRFRGLIDNAGASALENWNIEKSMVQI
jgi:hypothetical protein